MKLDAWLRQDRPPADRLRLVERLGQALNAVHDRSEVLTALEPLRIEVGNDRELRCDLSAAASGSPDPRYLAPERREGGPPSAEADVYATGLIAWETLAGRPCADPPASLSDVVPDVPQELASAVMACLERSPQWRPKDLTYLAQLAAAHQKVVRREDPFERAPQPPRAQPAAAPRAAAGRAATRLTARASSPQRESRSHLPLLGIAVLVVAAAAGSYFWFQRQGARDVPAPALSPPGPTTPLAATPEAQPAATRATTPAPRPLPVPGADAAATPAPTPTPTPAAAFETLPAAAAPTPTPTPTPTPVAPASVPPASAPPAPATAAPATAAPAPPRDTVAAPPPDTAPAPAEPVVLVAVSPLSVRKPGKVLLDLRGSGFRSDLRVRVLPIRESTSGIAVARQKWVSPSLVTVLLDLDESVRPGAYAIALEDPAGGQSKPLQITVTK